MASNTTGNTTDEEAAARVLGSFQDSQDLHNLSMASSPSAITHLAAKTKQDDADFIVDLTASNDDARHDDDIFQICESLKAYYCFHGKGEFFQEEKDRNPNKKASLLKQYRKAAEVGYCEIPLFHCRKWYAKLRLGDAIDCPEEMKAMVWHYNLIILDTSATNLHHASNTTNLKRLAKFIKLADKFYKDGFVDFKTTTQCIELALKTETTILVVAKRMKASTKCPPFHAQANFIIVAAITFCHCQGEQNPLKVSAAISWILVVRNDMMHPKCLSGWRRQGFGLFMIIAMIKYVYSMYTPKQLPGQSHASSELDIYLQSYDPSAYHFYVMLGFKQMNSKFKDGFELLPNELQQSYLRSALDDTKEPGKSVFHFYRRCESEQSTETPAHQLLRLPWQGLQHFREPKAPDTPFTASALRHTWCQYPPPFVRGIRLQYNKPQIEAVFKNLPLVKALFASPLEDPLPATAFFVKGSMTIDRRLTHTKEKGTTWMSSYEIDLMVATLMIDGRYNDSAFVLPCGYADTISEAFTMYATFSKARLLRDAMKNGRKSEVEIANAIQTQFNASFGEISKKHSNAMNGILKDLVHRQPGLLERNILIFPHLRAPA